MCLKSDSDEEFDAYCSDDYDGSDDEIVGYRTSSEPVDCDYDNAPMIVVGSQSNDSNAEDSGDEEISTHPPALN